MIQFQPLSATLKLLGKTTCLFCYNPATKAAVKGISEIRCCDEIRCTNLAIRTAEMDISDPDFVA